MKKITLNDIPHIDEELGRFENWEDLCKARGLKVIALNSKAYIGFLSSKNIDGVMVSNRLIMTWEAPWPETVIAKYFHIDTPGEVCLGSGVCYSVEII